MSKEIPHLNNLNELNVKFKCITPMILGSAEKDSVALRSAPFKNLFRQWFRIINGNLNPTELLKKEQELFGLANDIKDSNGKVILATNVSKMRFFINSNIDGKSILKTPLNLRHKKMLFGNPNASPRYIKTGTEFELKIFYPQEYEDTIKKILKAINNYGTIGLKSRKAFGSIQIVSGIDLNKIELPNLSIFDEKKEYPHCIYKIWKTDKVYDSWEEAEEHLLSAYAGKKNEGEQKKTTNIEGLYKNIKKYMNDLKDKKKEISKKIKEEKNERKRKELNEERKDISNKLKDRIPTQTRLIIKKENGKYVGKILHLRYNYPFFNINWDEIYKNIMDGNMKEEVL